MLRAVLGLVLLAVTCGAAIAEPKRKASSGVQKSELQNTERELVDALQTSSRNAKGKARPKAKMAK